MFGKAFSEAYRCWFRQVKLLDEISRQKLAVPIFFSTNNLQHLSIYPTKSGIRYKILVQLEESLNRKTINKNPCNDERCRETLFVITF
jgi:hypothetical protein